MLDRWVRSFFSLPARRSIRRFCYHTILRKRPVHFIHISKTGGTAIHMALRGHQVTKGYFLEFHHHRDTLQNIPIGEKIIFFVRDPVPRFISAFYTRWRKGQPRNHFPWTPRESQAFTLFQTPVQLAEALASVETSIRKKAQDAMISINHVRTFQIDWIGTVEYLNSREEDIFYIGRQETLSSDFEKIKSKLGVPMMLSLPTSDVDTHRTPEGLDKSMSQAGAKNIRKWYRKDCDLLDVLDTWTSE